MHDPETAQPVKVHQFSIHRRRSHIQLHTTINLHIAQAIKECAD
jgi:hypothetical protein